MSTYSNNTTMKISAAIELTAIGAGGINYTVPANSFLDAIIYCADQAGSSSTLTLNLNGSDIVNANSAGQSYAIPLKGGPGYSITLTHINANVLKLVGTLFQNSP